ncbi:MAG TPA: DNA-formamidopyrimidine glycosylase family protein [Acidimicrobiia bacterium]|jgi:formamidopyrimidine-DNA glycosylase
MPECIEVEAARVVIDEHAVGRTIAGVVANDAWYLKRGTTKAQLAGVLKGAQITAARRIGKQLLVDTTAGTLGLHLGMSGRVIVDGVEAGDPLLYASNRDVPKWRRFGLRFADGGSLWLRDPRRLGAAELDPDESRLGPDVMSLTRAQLVAALGSSRAPVKAVLMDQGRIAGLGNLLTDEALWRAGVDPARAALLLDHDERAVLHRAIRTTVRVCTRRGGSHTGDLHDERGPNGHCPRDGAELLRRTVGGRTTYSCPIHQT